MAQKNCKTMRIILIIFTCIIHNISNAQITNFNCEVIGQTGYTGLSSGSCTFPYSCNPSDIEVAKFIPNLNSKVKTVRLRFIIFHFSMSDPKNFQKSNPQHV